jgi:terminase small subunit / prophage DNA-packing protein
MIVNKTQLADIIGRTEEWITQAQKDQTFPVVERGRGRAGNKYETSDVIHWINRRAVDNLVGDKIDIEEAKRRKIAAEAALAEVELAITQGKLIPADQIEKAWSEMIMACRSKLLSIPTKASPEVFAAENLTEVKVILKQSINEAINELSVSAGDPEQVSDAVCASS